MNRILSISTAAFDGYELPIALYEISQLGVDYVELAYIQGYTDPFGEEVFSPGNAKRIMDLLCQANLSCFAFSAHMDLAAEGAIDIFTRRMEFAHRVGARLIVSNAGPKEDHDRFMKNMEILIRVAESLNMILGLENPGDGKSNLLNGGKDGAALIRQIGSDRVRINYDFGNVFSHFFGKLRPEEDYREILSLTAHFHIKDVKANEQGWFFTEIGRGSIDYESILPKLEAEHDSIPISLEVPLRVTRASDASPRRLPYPIPLDKIRTVLRNSVDYTKTMLSRGQSKRG
jgi:sugar phosphate isomerase/epimerase